MFKKIMLTGCTLLLLTACGVGTSEENVGTTNEPSAKSETNINKESTAIKESSPVNAADQTSTDNDTDTSSNPNLNNELSLHKESSDASLSNTNTSLSIDIINPTVSMTEAVTIFNDNHPGAKIESIDLKVESGRLHYEIEGFDSSKEYEMEIDATTKELKDNEVEMDRETDNSLDFSVIIDPAEAIEIASTITEVEGLAPNGWSLETDEGKQKYTIEYEKNDLDIDIKIDGITAEILEVEIDD